MKKEHSLLNRFTKFAILMTSVLVLSGCSTLSYVGSDYDAKNNSFIQTNELFNFHTYTKVSNTEKITMRVGVAESGVPEALAVYVNITNNSSDDYIFIVKDMIFKTADGTDIALVNPSSYLDAYQAYQTGTYAGLSSLAPTISQLANLQGAYQQTTTTSQIAERQHSATAASGQIGNVMNGISAHTISTAALIKKGNSNFYYMFIKDPLTYPISVKYKDLTYSFGSK